MARDGASILSKIFVPVIGAVLVAVLAGGTAPWWTKLVFGDGTGATPSPRPADTTVTPTFVLPGGTAIVTLTLPPLTDCVLTITFPFVSLYESPGLDSAEIAHVPEGSYATRATTVVQFAGQDQRWFQISVDGRVGWVMYETIQIAGKSAGCP